MRTSQIELPNESCRAFYLFLVPSRVEAVCVVVKEQFDHSAHGVSLRGELAGFEVTVDDVGAK